MQGVPVQVWTLYMCKQHIVMSSLLGILYIFFFMFLERFLKYHLIGRNELKIWIGY